MKRYLKMVKALDTIGRETMEKWMDNFVLSSDLHVQAQSVTGKWLKCNLQDLI